MLGNNVKVVNFNLSKHWRGDKRPIIGQEIDNLFIFDGRIVQSWDVCPLGIRKICSRLGCRKLNIYSLGGNLRQRQPRDRASFGSKTSGKLCSRNQGCNKGFIKRSRILKLYYFWFCFVDHCMYNAD